MSLLQDRFMQKVFPEPMSGCWLWVGVLTYHGYGQCKHDGRSQTAHRVAWELFKGPIPKGLEIDHLCRVRCCVNPDHLEPVTHAENIRRGSGGSHMRNRTHCPHGHPYNEENTLRYNGQRICRTCKKANWHRYKRAQELRLADMMEAAVA